MKRIWMILALTTLACSKAPLPVGPETKTTLAVSAIDQSGAVLDSVQVFLNSELIGFAPYRNENMKTGRHSVRLMRPGFQVFTEQFSISDGQFYNVEAVLNPLPPTEGQLIVSVDRDSALVKVLDSQEVVVFQTEARASSHMLQPGAYVVRAEKSTLNPVVEAVDIVAGKTTVVNLSFEENLARPELEFSIEQDTVKLGEALTLHWESDGYQVIIDQGIGIRGPNGSEKTVCPTPGRKVFTATAYGEGNLITQKSATAYIEAITVEPPSLEFSASPDSLMFGDPVFIEWQSDGYQVIIDQGVGLRGPIGSEEINFANPGKKVFTATAYGEENTLTFKQDSVFIKEAPMPALPVLMLSATRSVPVNEPATINWVSQNADYVVVDYVANADLKGSAKVSFATPGVRFVTATAYNTVGYVTATDTIEVVEVSSDPTSDDDKVQDIILSAESSVRADKGERGYVDKGAASFEIEKAGRYVVKATVWYNSGDSQLNESFYLELTNGNGDVKLPKNANAGSRFVVPDDPGEPHTAKRNSGTFHLTEGTYDIDVYHYAKIASSYPRFINDRIAGPESVKIIGFRIVFID